MESKEIVFLLVILILTIGAVAEKYFDRKK